MDELLLPSQAHPGCQGWVSTGWTPGSDTLCRVLLRARGWECKGEARGEALTPSLGTLEAVDVVREVQDLPTTHTAWKPRAFHPPWLWFGLRGKGDHSSRSVITFKSSQQPLWPGACPGE